MRAVPESPVVSPDVPIGGSGEAARLEALILRHCSRQIVAAAGRHASVVDVGASESASAALLRAALDRSPERGKRACRRVFVLPPGGMGRAGPEEGTRVLRELGERCGADDLLVAGAALPPPVAVGRTPGTSADEADSLPTSYPYSLGRFESLAADTGWRHCQLWSDGQARYAVHVLERSR